MVTEEVMVVDMMEEEEVIPMAVALDIEVEEATVVDQAIEIKTKSIEVREEKNDAYNKAVNVGAITVEAVNYDDSGNYSEK